MRLGMGSRWHPELVLPGTEQRDSVGTARGTGKGHCKARCGILGALGGVTGTGWGGRAMGQILCHSSPG